MRSYLPKVSEESKNTGVRKRSPERSTEEESIQPERKIPKSFWPTKFSDFDFTEEELKSIIELIPESENDPPLFIFWDLDNVESFRNKMAAYAGILAAPFPVPAAPTRNNLTIAIVNSWRLGIAGIPASVRGMCVPGSQLQENQLLRNATLQSTNAWWAAVDGAVVGATSFPLARLYILRPRSSAGDLDNVCAFP
jgi:hypothetical protein